VPVTDRPVSAAPLRRSHRRCGDLHRPAIPVFDKINGFRDAVPSTRR
jgi:hypothetical protein